MLYMENVDLATGKAASAIESFVGIRRAAAAGEFQTAGAGEDIDGIATTPADAAGDAFSYAIMKPGSVVKVLAGAAIASPNTEVATDAAGKMVAAVALNSVVGRNVHPGVAADEFVQIRLEDGRRVKA
jgi:polygalacturonase